MITKAEKALIKEAAEVAVSQSVSVTCPCCMTDWQEEGRPSYWRPERSMSVSRDKYGIKYHCFRATCARGSGVIVHISIDLPVQRKEFTSHEYKDPLRPLSEEEGRRLEKDFEITETQVLEQGIRYNNKRGTYIFPIRDVRGYTVGYVDRDFDSKRQLKAISYWFNDVPKLHFVMPAKDSIELATHRGKLGEVIIVEDIPSAIKAGKFMPAVALLGSHINDTQAAHLARLFDTAVLALDEDAFMKAVKLKNKYDFYFKEFRLLRLTEDIKNMKYTEIKTLLGLS